MKIVEFHWRVSKEQAKPPVSNVMANSEYFTKICNLCKSCIPVACAAQGKTKPDWLLCNSVSVFGSR